MRNEASRAAGPGDREQGRPAHLAAAIGRRRVALGFVTAPFVLWLAAPTGASLAAGAAIALLGLGVRLWAAGHLEKDREVTSSGPYRWTRHPLYAGSSLMALGLAVASARPLAGLLVLAYVTVTFGAAIRTEEARLAARFGAEYDAYRRGRIGGRSRAFSWQRALVVNREHRAVAGAGVAFGLLAVKAALGL